MEKSRRSPEEEKAYVQGLAEQAVRLATDQGNFFDKSTEALSISNTEWEYSLGDFSIKAWNSNHRTRNVEVKLDKKTVLKAEAKGITDEFASLIYEPGAWEERMSMLAKTDKRKNLPRKHRLH